MDLNSLLASLQNSGQQQPQTQDVQEETQNSLQSLLNSLKTISPNPNPSSTETKVVEQPPSPPQNTANNDFSNTNNAAPSLDNVLDSIKAFTSGNTDDSTSPTHNQQSQSTESTLSQLAALSTQSSEPPKLSPSQPQSSVQQLLSSIPPPLSSTPPQLSPTPPQLSPTPPQLSPTPPQLSPTPPQLSPTPPQLSPTPPQLSPTPPQLSPTPPQLNATSHQNSVPPPNNIIPPPLSTSSHQPLVPPPLSSTQQSQTPNTSTLPPPLNSQQKTLNSPAGLFTLNLSNQSQPAPSTASSESKAAAASNAIQSLFNSLQKQQVNNNSPASSSSSSTTTTASFTSPQLPTPTPNLVTKTSNLQNVSDYVKLEPLKISFPQFDFVNTTIAQTLRLEQGQTIQSILDLAVPNALIQVPSGTYIEEIEINKPVTLRAVGGKVNLIGKGENDTLLSRSSYFSIDGFNITQKESKSGCAVNIIDGFTKITNCTLKSPILSSLIAISNSNVYVESCEILESYNPNVSAEENSFVYLKKTKIIKSETYGVLSKGNSHVIIDSCQISDIKSNAVSSVESGSVYLKDSTITNIKNSGFETASSAKSYVENCTFSGIDACGVCANAPGQEVVVHRCSFTKCEMAGIKSSSHAKIRTFHNSYKDIGSNVMIISNDEGVIHCEDDRFEGTCLAAIVCFANGLIIGKDLTFENISGSALLSYEKGQIQVDLATINKCNGPGIHLRDQSFAKLRRITTKGGSTANLVINDGTTGEIIDSKFNSSLTIGAEVANTNNFVISNCEFCDNKVCGVSIHDSTKAVFESCKFKSNGQIGIDINGNGCSPVFNQCEISYNNEAGVNCFGNSSPVFNKCTLSMNPKIGFGCKGSNPVLNDSIITRNGQAAISVYDKAVFTLNRTSIDSNDNFAGQVFSAGAVCKLFDCKVNNHMISFIVSEGGKLRCKNTSFDKTKNPQLDVAKNGYCSLTGCDFGPAECGNGIQVHDNGKIKMKRTRVHDQSKLGLFVGDLGNAIISDHSVFENNGQIAVVCSANTKTEITDSTFNSNGMMSIQAQGGELTLQNCTITNHKQCGVFASKTVKFTYSGNNFSNNGSKDIVIQ